jgi:hypothetical protein
VCCISAVVPQTATRNAKKKEAIFLFLRLRQISCTLLHDARARLAEGVSRASYQCGCTANGNAKCQEKGSNFFVFAPSANFVHLAALGISHFCLVILRRERLGAHNTFTELDYYERTLQSRK